MNQPRQSPGQPTGGQYATIDRAESAVELKPRPAQHAFDAAYTARAAADRLARRAALTAIDEALAEEGFSAAVFRWIGDDAGELRVDHYRRTDGTLEYDSTDIDDDIDRMASLWRYRDDVGATGDFTSARSDRFWIREATPATTSPATDDAALDDINTVRRTLDKREFEIARDSIAAIALEHFPTAASFTVADEGDQGSPFYLVTSIDDADGNNLWEMDFSGGIEDELSKYSPLLDTDTDSLAEHATGNRSDPSWAFPISRS